MAPYPAVRTVFAPYDSGHRGVRMSAGVLTKEDVCGMRIGRVPDPAVGQVAALAAAFGVEPSYLVDRKEPPTLDEETLAALSDETAAAILRESARLPEREKRIVYGIARQFGEEFIHSRPRGKCLQHSFLALPVALQAPRAARWGYSCW